MCQMMMVAASLSPMVVVGCLSSSLSLSSNEHLNVPGGAAQGADAAP